MSVKIASSGKGKNRIDGQQPPLTVRCVV